MPFVIQYPYPKVPPRLDEVATLDIVRDECEKFITFLTKISVINRCTYLVPGRRLKADGCQLLSIMTRNNFHGLLLMEGLFGGSTGSGCPPLTLGLSLQHRRASRVPIRYLVFLEERPQSTVAVVDLVLQFVLKYWHQLDEFGGCS